MGLFDAYGSKYNAYDSYSQSELSPIMIIVLVIVCLFLIIAMSTIGFGLKAAFYRICRLKDLEDIGKEDYFYFFKKPYLVKTIKLGLVFSGVSMLAALLCVLPIIYAIVPLSLMIVIYAFNPDMSLSDIVKLGFDLGNKKWLVTFGLMFVSGFSAGIIGMLMCGIGIYVTASFSNIPHILFIKM